MRHDSRNFAHSGAARSERLAAANVNDQIRDFRATQYNIHPSATATAVGNGTGASFGQLSSG